MSFALFFRGFALVLISFAVVTFLITHSWWTTILHTVLCGILIQAGYFAAVLFLIWRSSGKRDAGEEPGRHEPTIGGEASSKTAASHLPNASRSRQS
jgi:exopolysaccharide production repressor protein